MLPDKMEHCIVFMNSWDVSGVFWSFSKCNITIPHFPTDPSMCINLNGPFVELISELEELGAAPQGQAQIR